MTRYVTEFMGIPAEPRPARGEDPNYGRFYRGMRMITGEGRAGYGVHRFVHRHDLETEGGFHGSYRQPRSTPERGFDPEWEWSGGVVDPHDPAFLHDFNAHAPLYADPDWPGSYARMLERRDLPPAPRRWMPAHGYRQPYGNRGLTDAGFGEGWARGPMRGAR